MTQTIYDRAPAAARAALLLTVSSVTGDRLNLDWHPEVDVIELCSALVAAAVLLADTEPADAVGVLRAQLARIAAAHPELST